MLLAVAIAVAMCGDAAYKQSVVLNLRHVEIEVDCRCLVCHYSVFTLLAIHLLARFGIEQYKSGGASHLLVGSVRHTCREHSAISRAHKARHIRLHHNGLLSHRRCRNDAIVHVQVVSQTIELPCGDTLGQREVD